MKVIYVHSVVSDEQFILSYQCNFLETAIALKPPCSFYLPNFDLYEG